MFVLGFRGKRMLLLLLALLILSFRPSVGFSASNGSLCGTCQCSWHSALYLQNLTLYLVNCSVLSSEFVPNGIPSKTESLSLRANGIKQLPTNNSLANSQLLELDLSVNKIRFLGRDVGALNISSLRAIDLNKNIISTVFNDAFQSLTSLEVLILSNNQIHYIENEAFSTLHDLKYLELSNNMIGSLYKEWFDGLDSTQILNLSHNRIHHLTGEVFKFLPSLIELILTGNRISKIDSTSFRNLNFLSRLFLESNLLHSVPGESIKELHQLEDLRLDSNPIRRIKTMDFFNLPLHRLSLIKMPELATIDKKAFKDLSNLRSLYLSDNPLLTYVHPRAFNNVTHLKELYLQKNNLIAVNKEMLNEIKEQVKVHIYGNPLRCDCNIRWVLKLLQKTSENIQIVKPDSLLCDSPENLRHHIMKTVNISLIPNTCPPRIVNLNQTISHKLGDPLEIECHAVGLPEPDMYWYLPDGKIINQTTNFVAKHMPEPGTLYFDHVIRSDSGTYKCIAQNTMGRDLLDIKVQVSDIDIHIYPVGISSKFVTLIWNGTARNSFPSYYIHYSDAPGHEQVVRVSSFMKSYTISNLSPRTTYTFCITFKDAHDTYITISCTDIMTQDSDFMSQGIHSTSTRVFTILSAVFLFAALSISSVWFFVRRYRHRFYENPDKVGRGKNSIPMESMKSPLVANMHTANPS